MTQIATVKRKLEPGFVEISVPRKSACGHDCEECAGCGMTGAAIQARASDPIGVETGDKVVVQSETKKLLGVAAGSCAFYHQRRTRTEDGRVYEYTRSFIRGDRVRLDVHMQKSGMNFVRTID